MQNTAKILPRVLVVYAYHRYPARQVILDHLYAFERSGLCECVYINLRYRRLPDWLAHSFFDLIVFDVNFAGQRWDRDRFRRAMQKAEALAYNNAPKALIVQDEFINTDLLNTFINAFSIDHVFTNLSEHEIPKVYDQVDRDKVSFTQVLTGYLDRGVLQRIEKLKSRIERDIDIGYRASTHPWFGRHGMLKKWVGEAVGVAARKRGFSVDIDTDQKTEADRLIGDDWYRFLLRSRYTVGVEGGTSVHDRDGSIKSAADAYLRANPEASFEEIEANCFPGQDGTFALFALSPRHLEACATRTCQILVEGDYNGVLSPGRHYIELKRDMSNLEQVLDQLDDETHRREIAERAYGHVVRSGRYTYEKFVELVLRKTLCRAPVRKGFVARHLVSRWMKLRDRFSWVTVWFVDTVLRPRH